MTNRAPEKMNKLIKQNWRRRRVPKLAEKWTAQGVSVSAVAHDRHWKLVDQLRGGFSWSLQYVENLVSLVESFVGKNDVVTILGWDVEYEPALLIASDALLRTIAYIDTIYPYGFILINEADLTVLLVDFDESEGIHANQIALPT